MAHVTDTHAVWSWNGNVGIREELLSWLDLLNTMADPPQLLLHTGDIINDALDVTKATAIAQVGFWEEVLASNAIPIRYAAGNHDKLGWARNVVSPTDPLYGTAFFTNYFEPERFYTFDLGGWRFIILDDAYGRPPRTVDSEGQLVLEYLGQLDEYQFSWLEWILSETPDDMPVLVASHLPIITSTVFTVPNWGADYRADQTRIRIRDSAMHADFRRVLNLLDPYTGLELNRQPKVKLCLSGHMHLFDHVVYQGRMHFITGPAVCGQWWSVPGSYFQTPAGFGLLDLYTDGSFEYRCVFAPGPNYSWVRAPMPVGVVLA